MNQFFFFLFFFINLNQIIYFKTILETKSNLKNAKQVVYNNYNGFVEADDVDEIQKLNSNDLEFDGNIHDDYNNQVDNRVPKIPIRFLEKVDFPHYGYLGEDVLLE